VCERRGIAEIGAENHRHDEGFGGLADLLRNAHGDWRADHRRAQAEARHHDQNDLRVERLADLTPIQAAGHHQQQHTGHGADGNRQQAEGRHQNDRGHDQDRRGRLMHMRQVGGCVEHQELIVQA